MPESHRPEEEVRGCQTLRERRRQIFNLSLRVSNHSANHP